MTDGWRTTPPPKSGVIIAYLPKFFGEPYVGFAEWDQEMDHGDGCWCLDDGYAGYYESVTHWMPMPDPPEIGND